MVSCIQWNTTDTADIIAKIQSSLGKSGCVSYDPMVCLDKRNEISIILMVPNALGLHLEGEVTPGEGQNTRIAALDRAGVRGLLRDTLPAKSL